MTHLPHGIPPSDEGFRLATIRRGGSAELRVTLAEGRDGQPRAKLRLWAAPGNGDGSLWPVPGRVISLGLDECGEVARVLAAVGGMGPDEIRGMMRATSVEAV